MKKELSDKTAERIYYATMTIFLSAGMYVFGFCFGYRSILFTIIYLILWISIAIIRNKKINKSNKNLTYVLVISVLVLLFNLYGTYRHQINTDRINQQLNQQMEELKEQEKKQN